MEAALGPLISALITVNLPRFLDWLGAGQEFEVLKGNVQFIRDEFKAIGCLIEQNRSIVRKDSRNFRKEWSLPLRYLANKIEDCFDQLQAAKTKEARDLLDKRIGELKNESEEKHEKLRKYFSNPPEKKNDAPDPPAAHETAPKADHEMVGIKEAVKELRALLRQSDGQSERKLRVICIVGFGGIGKTSLVSEVIDEFPHTWVSASGKNARQVIDELRVKLRNGLSGANSVLKKKEDALQEEQPPDEDGDEEEYVETDLIRYAGKGKGIDGASSSNNLAQVMNKDVHNKDIHMLADNTSGKGLIAIRNACTGTPQFVETNSALNKKNDESHEIAREFYKGTDTDIASTSNHTSEVMNDIGVVGASTSTSIKHVGRYLIVIDDVQERAVLQGISNVLREDMEVDSTIIATTTIRSVAYCDSGSDEHKVYKVKKLTSPDDQTSLFREVARMQQTDLSPVDEETILKVIGRCDGLPLALVSIAEDVRQESSGNRCAKALSCDVCHDECNGPLGRMQRVLFYSYHNLDSDIIKDFLLYFGMFPRGHPVKRDSLIRRWMAEGLITSNDKSSNDLNCILEALIDRNIIQPVPESNINENMNRCQLPGMILEYISHQSNSEQFMQKWLYHEDPPEEYVRRLTVHNYKDDRNITRADKFPNLRTLAVFPTKDKKEGGAVVGLKANFADYKFLRVLDLEECDGLNNKHLKAICDQLLLLKYLSLGGSITKVPREIARLECLQTLDLRRCCPGPNMTVKVPIELFYKLPELKHLLGALQLLISDCFQVWNLKKKLSDGCNLQTLAGFVIGKHRRISRLMIHMIARLRKLKIWCKSTADKTNLTHVSETVQKFIRDGTGSSAMPHGVDRSLSIHLKEGCSTDFLDFSNEAPGELTSLKLKGHLQNFPQFVSKLGGIKKLCISSTGLTGNTIITGVRGLKYLEYLKLVDDNLVELVIESKGESDQYYFRSLKQICLVSYPNLPRIEIQDGALKFLISLHLQSNQLPNPSVVIGVKHIKNLEDITLSQGDGDQNKENMDLKKLEDITLSQGDGDQNKENMDLWKEEARLHPNRPNVVWEIKKPRHGERKW